MEFKKLVYSGCYKGCNILITAPHHIFSAVLNNQKSPNQDILVSDGRLFNAHIWIHDGRVMKNNTDQRLSILKNKDIDPELKNLLENLKITD